jgi:hypothetical protein
MKVIGYFKFGLSPYQLPTKSDKIQTIIHIVLTKKTQQNGKNL